MAEVDNTTKEMEECDLVMKGGVTSGIVYPGALRVLSQRYRFRNIGGTSAGAIAATFAAAAEYGRSTGAPAGTAGFGALDDISRWLGTGTNLRDLFQASPSTRPLMKLLLAALAIKNSRGACAVKAIRALFALLASVPGAFVLGAMLGLLLALMLFFLPWLRSGAPAHWYHDPWFVLELLPAAAFVLIGGIIAGVIHAARILLKRVPENGFGICRGTAVADNSKPVLTDWLNETLNRLAGLAPADVLTIDHLKSQRITLALVTSSLSHGRPYLLPLERHDWLFRKSEMESYFPAAIVRHMIAKSRPSDTLIVGDAIKDDLFLLPEEADFPVIVAARMSLSFPVLFSAVPLYRPRFGDLRRGEGRSVHIDSIDDLDKCWFSDGGISSNFPIHFFDSWLPGRPTFGINLRGMPAREREAQSAQRKQSDRYFLSPSERVFLPKPGHATGAVDWAPLDGMFGLIGAIWNTAQNFRDNLQASLPSYDERIAHIRLDNDEGGLNLSMPPNAVSAVQGYGREAGDLLVQNFRMCSHQWTRMLMFLPLFEMNLKDMAESLGRQAYKEMLAIGPCEFAPYHRDALWIAAASGRIADLLRLVDEWKQRDAQWHQQQPNVPVADIFFKDRCPKPMAALRVVPNF